MSTDWGMLATSMQDTCRGVFLNRSRGGASISWDRKNFSGWVMGGRKPGQRDGPAVVRLNVQCIVGLFGSTEPQMGRAEGVNRIAGYL